MEAFLLILLGNCQKLSKYYKNRQRIIIIILPEGKWVEIILIKSLFVSKPFVAYSFKSFIANSSTSYKLKIISVFAIYVSKSNSYNVVN